MAVIAEQRGLAARHSWRCVWRMAYGVWCRVYGVWCRVYGVWRVVCDVWRMVYDVGFCAVRVWYAFGEPVNGRE